jgi:signal transduction histidine kinase/DNA-binding NarL/FixJ family response regulator
MKVPLRLALILPFLLQVSVAVGLTGYLSLRNGQKAVQDLARQLHDETIANVENELEDYLELPALINQINIDAARRAELDMEDANRWRTYLLQQVQTFESIDYIMFGGSQIGFVGLEASEDDENLFLFRARDGDYHGAIVEQMLSVQGQASPLPATASDVNPQHQDATSDSFIVLNRHIYANHFNPRYRDWYQIPRSAGMSQWSPIRLDWYSRELATHFGSPYYDQAGNFQGVFAVELSLNEISDYLRSIRIGTTGEAFIVERSGLLVASSSEALPFDQNQNRLEAIELDDPLIQVTAQELVQRFGSFEAIANDQYYTFSQNGEREWVMVTPFTDELGLDWLIVTVIPEADFMAQINANTRLTVLLCFGALAIASIAGIFTSRWLSRPILRLNQAAQTIASGQLNQRVHIRGIDELNTLGQSFNQMAQKLQESFGILERTNEELECRVEERTAQLQEAKDAADAANQAKSEFLANMSHELRTPLNGILGYAQTLQRSQMLPEGEQNAVSIIHQCGTHLLTLINDILDLSKIEARKMELHPRDVHFPSLLQGISEICRIRAVQKGIAFVYEASPTLPEGIHVDEKRLRQVLINLLSNAIKFTKSGQVTFSVDIVETIEADRISGNGQAHRAVKPVIFTDTEADAKLDATINTAASTVAIAQRLPQSIADNSPLLPLRPQPLYVVRFQVQDTGVGMSQEQLTKIFQPFEQVGSARQQSEGTGLGLAISQEIVAKMGGEIHVQSQPGEGSIFWFDLVLPAGEEWSLAAKETELGTVSGYRGDRQTILIADDKWENRSVLTSLLSPLGFQIIEAADGQEALDKAQTHLPHLFIVDLDMPIMDGMALLRHLRDHPTLQQRPVIISSASVFEAEQQKCLDSGADRFLPKPVEAEELLHQLSQLLNLEWIISQSPAQGQTCQPPPNSSTSEISSQDLNSPSPEILAHLHDLAMRGNLRGIIKEAKSLEQQDETLIPFARKLITLAKGFHEQELLDFIARHRKEETA